MSRSFDDMVEAIEAVASELENNSKVSFEVDDYNMLAFIGECLHDISDALKKIEAKMK